MMSRTDHAVGAAQENHEKFLEAKRPLIAIACVSNLPLDGRKNWRRGSKRDSLFEITAQIFVGHVRPHSFDSLVKVNPQQPISGSGSFELISFSHIKRF